MSKSFSNLKQGITCDDFITFGKYKDCIWQDVVLSDPEYVFWLVSNSDILLSKELLVASIKSINAAKLDNKKKKAGSYYYVPKGRSLRHNTANDSGDRSSNEPNAYAPGSIGRTGFDDFDDDIPW